MRLRSFIADKKIGAYVLSVAVLLSAIITSGCAQYYEHAYHVTIEGLNQYAGNGTTRILVPAPIMGQNPVFSEGADDAWNISVISCEHGPMIEFSTNSSKLSNISAEFRSGNSPRPLGPGDAEDYTTGIYLEPVCTVPRLYQSREYVSPFHLYMYTSYVYLDENLTSQNQSQPLEITLDIHFEANTFEAGKGNQKARNMYIQDTVMPDIKGWVPVIVSVKD